MTIGSILPRSVRCWQGMKADVPAPGFRLVSGKRGPRGGEKFWVQLRSGWVDELGPWPANGPRWEHDGSAFDVVAVRRA